MNSVLAVVYLSLVWMLSVLIRQIEQRIAIGRNA